MESVDFAKTWINDLKRKYPSLIGTDLYDRLRIDIAIRPITFDDISMGHLSASRQAEIHRCAMEMIDSEQAEMDTNT